MKRSRGTSILLLTVVAIGAWISTNAQQSATSGSSKASKNPVHEITLPDIPTNMPAGPNLAAYQQKCLLCHSSRYVTMQPRFSKTVWEKEVKKMVDVYGAPITPEPAADKGFKIERLYYTLDGKAADPTRARQHQRFAVVLKVTEPQPQYGRVIVADYLPAGFEIDNPRLVSSGDTGTLGWIEDAAEPVYSEFRDDHFSAAFDRGEKSPAVMTVAYVVRAVSPGTYVHPQAFVEDMYNPDRFGRTGSGQITVSPAK